MPTLSLPEYEGLDAVGLANLIRTGQITPLEALTAAQERASARSHINSIAMRHDDMALGVAQKMSALSASERASQTEQAPLWGVPFALKDLGIALKGTVTTQGCAFFKDAIADHDSTLVQRYQAVVRSAVTLDALVDQEVNGGFQRPANDL